MAPPSILSSVEQLFFQSNPSPVFHWGKKPLSSLFFLVCSMSKNVAWGQTVFFCIPHQFHSLTAVFLSLTWSADLLSLQHLVVGFWHSWSCIAPTQIKTTLAARQEGSIPSPNNRSQVPSYQIRTLTSSQCSALVHGPLNAPLKLFVTLTFPAPPP